MSVSDVKNKNIYKSFKESIGPNLSRVILTAIYARDSLTWSGMWGARRGLLNGTSMEDAICRFLDGNAQETRLPSSQNSQKRLAKYQKLGGLDQEFLNTVVRPRYFASTDQRVSHDGYGHGFSCYNVLLSARV